MAERKKPKPPVPGKPKPTPAKKKPAAQVPVTSVTPRSTVKKPSAKQVAGTRKLVANLAGVTPIGRGAKLAQALRGKTTAAKKLDTKIKKFSNYGGEAYVNMGKKTTSTPKVKVEAFHPFGYINVKGSKKNLNVNAYKRVFGDMEGSVPRNIKKNPSINKAKPKVQSVKSVAKKKK
jgi:hypothetical protein